MVGRSIAMVCLSAIEWKILQTNVEQMQPQSIKPRPVRSGESLAGLSLGQSGSPEGLKATLNAVGFAASLLMVPACPGVRESNPSEIVPDWSRSKAVR